jgi:hypothetical protein
MKRSLSRDEPGGPEIALDLGIEELDEMLAPWDWDDFFGGVGIGVGLVGLYAGGAALAT